jgi:hypothetical protein
MPTWPVYLDAWQIECCGDAFPVGHTVAWTLVFVDDADAGPADAMFVDLEPTGRRHAQAESGAEMVILSVGEVEVATFGHAGEGAASGPLRGVLYEEHHGGVPASLRATRGVVRRLRVVSRECRLEDRSWQPLAGTERLRDVDRVPDHFAALPESPGRHRHETGVLADLELEA